MEELTITYHCYEVDVVGLSGIMTHHYIDVGLKEDRNRIHPNGEHIVMEDDIGDCRRIVKVMDQENGRIWEDCDVVDWYEDRIKCFTDGNLT